MYRLAIEGPVNPQRSIRRAGESGDGIGFSGSTVTWSMSRLPSASTDCSPSNHRRSSRWILCIDADERLDKLDEFCSMEIPLGPRLANAVTYRCFLKSPLRTPGEAVGPAHDYLGSSSKGFTIAVSSTQSECQVQWDGWSLRYQRWAESDTDKRARGQPKSTDNGCEVVKERSKPVGTTLKLDEELRTPQGDAVTGRIRL